MQILSILQYSTLNVFLFNRMQVFTAVVNRVSLFTSSKEDSSMAIETSATQQSRRPRHNPENNNPVFLFNTKIVAL
jgi:hypothetical protein